MPTNLVPDLQGGRVWAGVSGASGGRVEEASIPNGGKMVFQVECNAAEDKE